MKFLSFAFFFLFFSTIIFAQDVTITIGATDIVIPIPEGFTDTGKAPRDIKKADIGSVRRYMEYVKLTNEPVKIVRMFNIQTTTSSIDVTFPKEEFEKLKEQRSTNNPDISNENKEYSLFSGDSFFERIFFEKTPRAAQGDIITILLVKNKLFHVNYIIVSGKDNFDVIKNLKYEARAFCEAIIAANMEIYQSHNEIRDVNPNRATLGWGWGNGFSN